MRNNHISPFQMSLEYGKQTEMDAAIYLKTLGFAVKDMSTELMANGHYPPFDLLAVRGDTIYVVDVKLRLTHQKFWFRKPDLIAWILYDTSATKMVLFSTRIMDMQTYRYILVRDIPIVAYHKRSHYTLHIKLEDTKELE